MTMTSFVAVVALHTARIVKNGLSVFETLGFKIIKSVSVFEREENLLQNTLHFVFKPTVRNSVTIRIFTDEN